MTAIHHINIANEQNQVYCCLRNRVVQLDEGHKSNFCNGCKMFRGDANAQGVECIWDDYRPINNPHVVTAPYDEWMSNQKRKIPHYPEQQAADIPEDILAAGL